MSDRINAMANRCRNRGGDCHCIGECQAMAAVQRAIRGAQAEMMDATRRLESMRQIEKRLQSKPATLKEGFVFEAGMTPVVYLDGDDSCWGYEDDGGNFHERDGWPFSGDVWRDDCERLGFRVET